jgi:hypothetical protein
MVAGADPNLRDWSGRKPRQYQLNQYTSVSADTFSSEYLSDRLLSVRLSTNPSPAANNTHTKIQRSLTRHSFLRKSLMYSDHRKHNPTKHVTLYKWLSHVTRIVNLSGLLVWIMETIENPYVMENVTFLGNAVESNTYKTTLCSSSWIHIVSICLLLSNDNLHVIWKRSP